MRILTIDLGTSATKAALWSEDGPIAWDEPPCDVEHPRPGLGGSRIPRHGGRRRSTRAPSSLRTERAGRRRRVLDPARHVRPRDDGRGARSAGRSRRRTRSADEAAGLGPDFQVLTGVVPDAGTVAAKVAWIRRHEPDRLSGGHRWILGARDLVAFRLTGRGVTDHVGRVADRLARPRRRRPRRRRAPPGGRRPDDHRRRQLSRRRRPPLGVPAGTPVDRGCRRSRVRAARRRGHDRPTDGVVGDRSPGCPSRSGTCRRRIRASSSRAERSADT